MATRESKRKPGVIYEYVAKEICNSVEVYDLDDLVTGIKVIVPNNDNPEYVLAEVSLMRRGRDLDQMIAAVKKYRKLIERIIYKRVEKREVITSRPLTRKDLKIKRCYYNHSTTMLEYFFDVLPIQDKAM